MTTQLRATVATALAMLAVAAPSAFARATDGTISGVAGTTAGFAGDGGPAVQAQMDAPADVAFLSANSYLIADFNNDRIREVFPDGKINTVAGSDRGYFGDGGPATDAGLDRPQGVTPLSGGAYLIADTFNHVIRKVDANGIINTIAGNDRGFGGDGGPATGPDAAFAFPSDTAVMPDGSILIADTGNDRIRKIAPNGILSTVAGTTRGFGGDGGPATQAKLNPPRDVTVASDGAILIADTGNSRVRRVDPNGTITTVAGLGAGLSGDGDPASKAKLNAPASIVAAAHGGFIVADTLNNRIRRITPMGAIFTVAGTGAGNSGNGGLAKNAKLNQPGALALAPNGGFLVADTANATIRRVSDIGAVPPAQVGDSFGVAPSTGNVTIQPNGQHRYIRLQEEDLIPNFSQVDATNGEMDLTMARDAGGLQQTAHVFWSPFTVTQGSKGQPFTQFKIPPPDCGSSTKATAAKTHKKKKRKQRRLWVSETGGNWKTATGSVSAGAIGTEWVTTSLCDGTRVTVRRGIVRVIDRKHRPHKVVLHAGDTFRTPTR
jgi:hypothetical protein